MNINWESVRFWIANAKSIAIAGLIFWLIIVLSLNLAGLIDVETDCPICARIIDHILPDALASNGGPAVAHDGAWLRFRVTVLPNL